jgi:L-iditol 2-dehydrogenase
MLLAVRALILHGPGDLRLEEVPDPRPGPGELVVEVLVAITCATDAKMARSGAHPALGPLPAPLGHEVAGRVIEVGDGVVWPRPGDEVVVANSAPCKDCPACRAGRPNLCGRITYLTGAFAERLLVPAPIAARNTHPLPAGLAPRVGALAEPVACALHSARRAGPVEGRVVLVLGGGFQGRMLAGLLARAGGRVHLADPHPARRAAAERAGAERTHDAPRDDAGVAGLRAALAGGEGADLVVEAVGRPETWEMAVALARPGGEVLMHGGCPVGTFVTLPTHAIHYSELTIRGVYHHTPAVFRAALDLLTDPPFAIADVLKDPIRLDQVADVLRASRGDKHPVMPG